MNEFPTPWQRKTMWSALTALSVVGIGAIAVGLVWLVSTVIGFLQPILIPFAIAGVMAYLLEPVVAKIVAWGTSRQRAVMSVFALVSFALAGVMVWIIPAIWVQTVRLVHKVPTYRDGIVQKVGQFNEWAQSMEKRFGVHGVVPQIPEKVESPLTVPDAVPAPKTETVPVPADSSPTVLAPAGQLPDTEKLAKTPAVLDLQDFLRGDWLRTTLPLVLAKTWSMITNSVGGFLGVFGFLLSMVIVPIYLYYFLIEIAEHRAVVGRLPAAARVGFQRRSHRRVQ